MSTEANIPRSLPERARRRGDLGSSIEEFLVLFPMFRGKMIKNIKDKNNEVEKPRNSKFRKFLSIVSCGLIDAVRVLEDDEIM